MSKHIERIPLGHQLPGADSGHSGDRDRFWLDGPNAPFDPRWRWDLYDIIYIGKRRNA